MAESTKRLLEELRDPSDMAIADAAAALREFIPALHSMVREARRIIECTQQAELDEEDRTLRVSFEGLHQKVGAVEHLGAQIDRNMRQLVHAIREIGDVVNGVQRDGGEERLPGIRQKAEEAGYKNVWPKKSKE